MQAYRADSALHSYTHGKSQLCSDHSDAEQSKKPAVRQSVGTRHVLYEQAGGGVNTLETHGADALHSDPLGFSLFTHAKQILEI